MVGLARSITKGVVMWDCRFQIEELDLTTVRVIKVYPDEDPEYFNFKLACTLKQDPDRHIYCAIRIPVKAFVEDRTCYPLYGICNLLPK